MYDLTDFVNRTDEIDAFWSLLESGRQRVLLVEGEQDVGKSYLLDYLHQQCVNEGITVVHISFQEIRPNPIDWQTILTDLADQLSDILTVDEGFYSSVRTYPDQGQSWVNLVAHQGATINVSGTIVGRDMTTFNSASGAIGTPAMQVSPTDRQRLALRDLLQEATKSQKVLLFFDGYEEMMPTVFAQIQQHLLTLYRSQKFRNLWVVLAGRKLSIANRHYATMQLEPFESDHIREYWVVKLGMDEATVESMTQLSGGVPGMIRRMAEYAMR